MVEGKYAGAAGNDNQKTGSPDAVLRPSVGIDKNLDHSGSYRGGEWAIGWRGSHEQHRKEMLAESGDFRPSTGSISGSAYRRETSQSHCPVM